MLSSDNNSSVHQKIDQFIKLNPGGVSKTSLNEIDELSDYSWDELRAKINAREIHLRHMSISPNSFEIVANSAQKKGFTFFNMMVFVMPVIAILLAVFVKWWLIFIAILSLYMLKIARGFYMQSIFENALVSEKCFSFLFSRNAICLDDGHKIVFRHNE